MEYFEEMDGRILQEYTDQLVIDAKQIKNLTQIPKNIRISNKQIRTHSVIHSNYVKYLFLCINNIERGSGQQSEHCIDEECTLENESQG